MREAMLQKLRERNPGLRLYGVWEEEFRPYGRLLQGDTTALAAALGQTPVPDEGNSYVACVPELEAVPLMAALRREVFGETPIQAGYCNGRGHKLNALEYHKCSELNYSTSGLVLLLALPGQLEDGRLDSGEVVGFYLPPDVLAEIFPRVLHFAPCRIDEEGFRCLVVLEKGTNEALDRVDPTAQGEEKLLWMRNKWMTCHPDSPQRQKGAFVGISGENLELKI